MLRYKNQISLVKIIAFMLMSLLFVSINAWASDTTTGGIGQVANNILEPVTIVANFLASMSIVIGMTSLFSAFLRYLQHRVNPLAQPMGTVILLFVLGVFLLLLPFVYKLTDSGIAFSLG